MISECKKPQKEILRPEHLRLWIGSSTYNLFVNFIQDLQNLVIGLTNNAPVHVSNATECILDILKKVEKVTENHPVIWEKDVSRFGKREFRDFYDEVSENASTILRPLVEIKLKDENDIEGALLELVEYFKSSWGDRTRIDYGSGHESNFMAFLLCLERLQIIEKKDYAAIVLKVFNSYTGVMRTLEKKYWLEAAGSHGVWGLDDYHFLPFLFGASQLSNHPHLKPKLIHNEELVECFHRDYMYFECVYFTKSIKTIPHVQSEKLSLRWHSPMLDDILSAKSWLKIKEGMIKMYKAEVLGKLPIIQHFMFGSLIPCPDGIDNTKNVNNEAEECAHKCQHLQNTWGDCCGIKVPSAIAASEMNRRLEQSNHAYIPFD